MTGGVYLMGRCLPRAQMVTSGVLGGAAGHPSRGLGRSGVAVYLQGRVRLHLGQ